MDNKAYLQSIAVSAPVSEKRLDKNFAKVLKIAIIAIFSIIIFMIVMLAINSLSKKPENFLFYLQNSSNSLVTAIDKYNPDLKSPGIRKLNSALKTTLIGLNSTSANHIRATIKKPVVPTDVASTISRNAKTLDTSLSDARLNAHLDTTYKEQILYQISLITSRLRELPDYQKSLPATVYSALSSHKSNLETVQTDISNFYDPSV